MALPREPRQKMINLMYLVLTALLALNVSAEILNAFKTVNNSLTTASNTIDAKNKTIFESFKELKENATTKDRALIWAPKAEQAKRLADQLVVYIEGLKKRVLNEAQFNPQTG